MAIIRASCTECGELELTVGDVRVRTSSADDSSTYIFRCPHCEMIVLKPVAARTVEMLVQAGVHSTVWHMPAEIKERPNGPLINHDDLLDFHKIVNGESVMEAITGSFDVGEIMAQVARSQHDVTLDSGSQVSLDNSDNNSLDC